MDLIPEDIFKLLLSMALGGLVGAEREVRDKDAGFRTLMLISTGATLFTIFSVRISAMAGIPGDPARIAAQIVSGIGFLGAGVILRQNGEVRGLTTAATIWLAAALGIGVGSGMYLFTSLTTVVLLLALFIFPTLERTMGTISQIRQYRIIFPIDHEKFEELNQLFEKQGLVVISRHVKRHKNKLEIQWSAAGRPNQHEQMMQILFDDPDIDRFEF